MGPRIPEKPQGGIATVKQLLPDALWNVIEPLLPKHVPSSKGGHPRVDDRRALIGILFA